MSHDATAYLNAVAPHAASHLRLHEQVVTTLKNLRYHDQASRASTASALRTIQAKLNGLAPTMMSVRAPGALAMAGSAQAKAVQHLSAAIGDVAAGLHDQSQARARLESAHGRVYTAASDIQNTANALAVVTGLAAAVVAATPVVGPNIAGVLAAVTAATELIEQVVAESRDEKGGAKEVGAKERHSSHWPP